MERKKKTPEEKALVQLNLTNKTLDEIKKLLIEILNEIKSVYDEVR